MNHPLHRDHAILTMQQKPYCDERVIIEWIDEMHAITGAYC
ncbi:hypothetical protein L917_02254 [Phytophthora nicotianae]|uniref:Uncharacterized protein n=3 Tax=Phytophthora nicotianae TaxID=4792 RepID=W2QPH9_PHYN3|nr:hypothetical protein PPTG_22077 [Phytophthora nicotianae INRA-310]ETI54766.1 hypothetical protein F443_02481 [Phytophthora nicotianae P1569]ETM01119.1 hypothetical protein L917_02254 [Phytophthora nicotianae]ETM54293.1 hypothetical protein L914_02354 [Phytophthora nicotianae]ETN15102.1 hypothetical protein PPTG_22077 [Phytophthora nicotianae INRA-310]